MFSMMQDDIVYFLTSFIDLFSLAKARKSVDSSSPMFTNVTRISFFRKSASFGGYLNVHTFKVRIVSLFNGLFAVV